MGSNAGVEEEHRSASVVSKVAHRIALPAIPDSGRTFLLRLLYSPSGIANSKNAATKNPGVTQLSL